MHKVLCSVGAVITRANGRDHRLLSKLRDELCCDGFEFLFYDTWYDNIGEIVRYISSLDLYIPALHCDKRIGELIAEENEEAFRLFEINCRAAYELGARLLVLHLWNGLVSDSNFQANAGAFGRLRETAEKYGLLLTVENVVCNNSTPLAHLKELVSIYPDIRFTFDTKMAEFHGELLESLEKELWRNIRHIHINDYAGDVMDWGSLRSLHIGEGHVRFDLFFEFIKSIGYDGDITVEATSVCPDGSVDIDKLNTDFMKIKGYFN